MKFKTKAILIFGIFFLGMVFPPWFFSGGNFWYSPWENGSITGWIISLPTKIIYDQISQQAVQTLACIDERDGTVAGYSAFEAQIGKIQCN